VAVAGDGTKVYVSLQGSELEPGSEVAVYDVAADRVARRILLRPARQPGPPATSPFRLTLHPGGRFLLVTSRLSSFASVIDTRRDEVVAEVPLDSYCQGVAFDRRKHRHHLGHQRQRLVKLGAGAFKDDDDDADLRRILLEAEIAVGGEKHVELVLLGQGEQLAVLDTAPAHLRHRRCEVAGERTA
jgi:YVTN family beta-propeller protein